MLEAFTQSLHTSDDVVTWTSALEHLQNASHNITFREDCIKAVFSELEFLPWDNPDNIVSAKVEEIASQTCYHLLAVLFVIGFPANVINMAVFYKQGLKDRVNMCLFVLSLSDGMYLAVFLVPFCEQLYLRYTTQERYGPILIFVNNYNINVLVACGFVSPILSAIISAERCLCVFNPLKCQRLLRTRTMAGIIIGVYIVIYGLFFIVAFRYTIKCIYDPTSGVVETNYVEGEFYQAHKDFIDQLESAVFGASLPGVVLVVVTTTTIMTIIKLRQIVTWRSDMSSSVSLREVALTKMLVVNSILFIICFSPDALHHVSRFLVPEMRSGGRYHNFYLTALWIGDIFTFFNATLNIFVYYTMGSRYRETFWALFGRKSKPGKEIDSRLAKTKSRQT